MYDDFFGFARRPFSLMPDPEFLFWTEQHRHAFDLICMSLLRHAPISLITGEIGAGKTTLIRALLDEISDDLEVALLSNVVGDSGDLLRWILTAFGQDAEPSSHAEALRAVEAFLGGMWADGRRSVLIVDEAQNVSDSGIETLRLLTNLDVGKATPLSLVLAGQPQLRDRLRGPKFAAFRQRLGASCHLGPMTLSETKGYVSSRLQVAGGDPDLFDAGAIEAVHRRANGVPRLTNLLCDVCLLSAYGEDRVRIDAAFAEVALADSLAVAGLGGLAAEPQEAAKAQVLDAAAGGRSTASSPVLGPSPTPRPASVPTGARRRTSAPPVLRVVPDAPLPPAKELEEEPVRLAAAVEAEAPRLGTLEVPAAPVPVEPAPGTEPRPGQVWRKAVGSAAGLAIAAFLACAALVFPAGWTDAGQAVSAVATLWSEPGKASVPTEPAVAIAEIAAAAAPPEETSDGTVAVPEVRPGPADSEVAELLFRRALDTTVSDPVAAAIDYSRAAARGHHRAAYYLAQMYETGDGVLFAPDTARAWYARAAEGVRGADERLAELAAYSPPPVGTVQPLFSEAAGGVVDLVWQGRGAFAVELAAAPGEEPDITHSTPLTAVRLTAPPEVGWWRVRAVGGQPSDWLPVGSPSLALDRTSLR